jgi:DNA-binding NarL/FixJ family response regulator
MQQQVSSLSANACFIGEREMNVKKVKVLLADDYDVVRAGVRTIVEARGWQVCAEATNGRDAIKFAIEERPDVVVLDMEMGELDVVTVTRQIKEHQPGIEVVIFTMHDNEYLIREVLSAGARGFVLKSEGGQKLVEAIENALKHTPFFAAKASETLLKDLLKSPNNVDEPLLTYRECEVVRLLAGGRSNKEVAASLGISVKTVETHRAKIMRKLGISSIVKLVRFAVRENIIKA